MGSHPVIDDRRCNLRLILRLKVQSRNAVKGRHWSVYAKYAKEWLTAIRTCLTPRAQPIDHKLLFTVVSYRTRELDDDNLVGGCKPIPDALVKLGIIQDDTPEFCTMHCKQVIVPNRLTERTEIVLHTQL